MSIMLNIILFILLGFLFGYITTEPMHVKKTKAFQFYMGFIFAIFFGTVSYLTIS